MAFHLRSGFALGAAMATVGLAGITVFMVTQNRHDVVGVSSAPLSAVVSEIAKPVKIVQVPPRFDLVRIETDGSAIIAGVAGAGRVVALMLDGVQVAQASADKHGKFVALLTIPPSDVARELTLVEISEAGQRLRSKAASLILPFKGKAPKVVVAQQDQITVQTPAVQDHLSLETIHYSAAGDVVVAGLAPKNDTVQVYLNNAPHQGGQVGTDGKWQVTLSDVKDGLYDLRVDHIDPEGKVAGRVQSPFKRVVAQASSAPSVTIQPGFTLWQLAQNKYGDGAHYVQIFEANQDLIRDPDLIYPGQIFILPN